MTDRDNGIEWGELGVGGAASDGSAKVTRDVPNSLAVLFDDFRLRLPRGKGPLRAAAAAIIAGPAFTTKAGTEVVFVHFVRGALVSTGAPRATVALSFNGQGEARDIPAEAAGAGEFTIEFRHTVALPVSHYQLGLTLLLERDDANHEVTLHVDTLDLGVMWEGDALF